ncbi:MAG: deoxyuridine 5'-triphosphate nucleotidohydrolase [Legionellales bacterium]|nr:deoxyuridine 5'-triphosphate nucleotidohydrolase [Legionellales bacterium]|tara:strand:+ start:7892 stop:8350 length:459 start_codon:yes stop_codon:yes gene_type:complete
MVDNKVKVFKVHENAKIPKRAHPTDAGIDFFYCPEKPSTLAIEPGQSVLLPTGIKMEVPQDHMLQIMNKSGIASKRSLITGACVVDEGYTGEIFVNLHNIGTKTNFVESGQKIAQGVFIKIQKPDLCEIMEDVLYEGDTSRGAGALGSTGDS